MTSWSIAIKTVGSRAHTATTTSGNKLDTSTGESERCSGGGGASPSINSNSTNSNSSTNATTNNGTSLRTSSSISDTSEANFTIQVNPDDPLHSLHEKIEVVTGLTAEQQRLIYRGRIINSNINSHQQHQSTSTGTGTTPPSRQQQQSSSGRRRPPTEAEILLGETTNATSASASASAPPYNYTTSTQSQSPVPSSTTTTSSSSSRSTNLKNTSTLTPRVRDVNGLCDQQTIHLVPRLHNPTNASSSNASNSNSRNNNSSPGTGRGGGGGLGSLLGDLGSTGSGSSNNNNNVTSLSGEAGMSLLAALLGAAGGGGTDAGGGGPSSATNMGGGGGGSGEATANTSNRSSGTTATTGGGAILGSTEGLGGVIDRAVMMGVLDENTTAGRVATSSTTTATGGTTTGGGEGLFSLLNGSGNNNNNNRPSTTTTPRANSPTDPLFPRLSTPLTSTARRTMGRTAQQQQRNGNNRSNNSNASAAARARASAARLTESDIRVMDPGSVEPVRQGMMTLHTLLGNARLDLDYNVHDETNGTAATADDDNLVGSDANDDVLGVDGTTITSSFAAASSSSSSSSPLQQQPRAHQRQPPIRAPLDSHRQWYRGQWLDALDTVNQWLEATIVDIVLPEDILPNYQLKQQQQQQCSSYEDPTTTTATVNNNGTRIIRNRTRRATPDAVVSANDLEGRRRLLLEPIPEDEIGIIEPPPPPLLLSSNNDNNFNSTTAGTPEEANRQRSILNAHANEILNPSNNNNSPSAGRGATSSPSSASTNRMRPRPDNTNVQLLLIHYNGWPHRWDEWIRSDSERIRTFRTRTRHRLSSLYSSPTPTAVFPAAPSTVIRDEDDDLVERSEMILELGRVLGGVERLLSGVTAARSNGSGSGSSSSGHYFGSSEGTNVVGGAAGTNNVTGGRENGIHGVEGVMSGGETSRLPWRQLPPPIRHGNGGNLAPLLFSTGYDNEANGEDYDNATTISSSVNNDTLPDPRSYLDSARLRQLAPLIDRLGRTLTDAAPHIAALADALPTQPLLPSSSPHPFGVESSAVSARAGSGVSMRDEDPIQSLAARASHLYFGIGNDDDDGEEENDNSATTASSSALASSVSPSAMTAISNNNGITEQILSTETTPIIDPDLTDYINGMVNTTRGVNGRDSGSSSGGVGGLLRSGGSGGDSLGTSLLANYLSSMGGGLSGGTAGGGNTGDNTRVIRMGGGTTAIGGSTGPNGGGGPGIDIHIHAIVTGPGMPGGSGGGIGGLGGIMDTGLGMDINANNRNSGSPFANSTTFATATPSTPNNEEDNLFSELYSESPQPVNLHGEDDARIEGIRADAEANDLNLLFAECHSIDEESTDDDEDLHPTEAEVALSMVNNIPCIEADSIVASQLTPINTDTIGASNTPSSGSSILALSEIESEESADTQPPPSQSSSLGTNNNDNSNAGAVALNSSLQGSANRSPSFGNRLFRRTFGRIPSRRGGNGRSA